MRDGVVPTLALDDVFKDFRGVHALAGVTLSIGPAEIVGLIGPNGSGKTTLLNVASGVNRPTSGHIAVAGTDVTGRPTHAFARRGVGRTFQQIRLFAGLDVRENVTVGAVARGRGADRVDWALELLDLGRHADRPAVDLAYGVQRRVEIARALAGEPSVLLLDEPAAGMNEEESDALLVTIRELRAEVGCAVLIVDHDLRLIMRLCDRLHVLGEGRTIAKGAPEQVRADPAVIEAYLGVRHDVTTRIASQRRGL